MTKPDWVSNAQIEGGFSKRQAEWLWEWMKKVETGEDGMEYGTEEVKVDNSINDIKT